MNKSEYQSLCSIKVTDCSGGGLAIHYRYTMNYATNKEPMVLPQGVFCPYNAQSTLHLYEAFWSMLLPKTLNSGIFDIR